MMLSTEKIEEIKNGKEMIKRNLDVEWKGYIRLMLFFA